MRLAVPAGITGLRIRIARISRHGVARYRKHTGALPFLISK